MPCRCSSTCCHEPGPPDPPRRVPCCCASRGAPGPGGSDHQLDRDNWSCTADTCANPQFCKTFKPEYCPNTAAVDATPQEENWNSYHAEDRPPSPPFHEVHPAPYLPPQHCSYPGHCAHCPHFPYPRRLRLPPHSPHLPQSSCPLQHNSYYPYRRSPIPLQQSVHLTPRSTSTSQQSSYVIRGSSENTPNANKGTTLRDPSTAVVDDPFEVISTRAQSGRSHVGRTTRVPSPSTVAGRGVRGESPRGQQSARDGARARPITTPSSNRPFSPCQQCCQQDQRKPTNGSHKSVPAGAAGVAPSADASPKDFARAFASGPSTGGGAGAVSSAGAGCECRMPPALARLRCTGNLDGFCSCAGCTHNK